MRITEGQLRRIIRQEIGRLSEGETFSLKPGARMPAVGERIPLSDLEQGMSDFEGPGARAAMKMREPQIMSVGNPDYLRRQLSAGELEDYGEEAEEEYDPEDPYGNLPKGASLPGRGLVRTAGFSPGENPFRRNR